MAIKTYLVGLTIVVRHLCHYFNKYQTHINAAIDASSLTSDQKLTVHVFLDGVQLVCGLLEGLTGY